MKFQRVSSSELRELLKANWPCWILTYQHEMNETRNNMAYLVELVSKYVKLSISRSSKERNWIEESGKFIEGLKIDDRLTYYSD